MKRVNVLLVFMSLAVATMTTSCLKTDDTVNTSSASLYCTVTGSNPDYTLYADGGIIVNPTSSSVKSITNNAGLGTAKRLYLTFSYKESNMTTNTTTGVATITDAELQYGSVIPTKSALTKALADSTHVTATDSIFTLSGISNVWAYNGYLTVIETGYYSADSDGSGIYPTTNLVYAPEDVSENAINFTLYYNRHCSQSAEVVGSQSFLTSFSLEELADVIPGTGDITITITPSKGGTAQTCTVTRKQLYFEKFS